MLKTKRIVTVLLMVAVLLVIGVQAKATSDNPHDLNLLIENSNKNQIVANSMVANAEAANSQALSANSLNGNTLPQTGVTEDITVMFFIIVCVISAVYAYKKIRDYKM